MKGFLARFFDLLDGIETVFYLAIGVAVVVAVSAWAIRQVAGLSVALAVVLGSVVGVAVIGSVTRDIRRRRVGIVSIVLLAAWIGTSLFAAVSGQLDG